uniref:Uncharacterized protein n=1 Tax=Romanomermis culicivorax TaxID=13658 RepID=A0A915JI82_ROMCU
MVFGTKTFRRFCQMVIDQKRFSRNLDDLMIETQDEKSCVVTEDDDDMDNSSLIDKADSSA